MPLRALAAALLAALAAFPVAAQGRQQVKPKEGAASDEAAIMRIAQEVFESIKNRDTAALGRHMTDDFVHRMPGDEAGVGKAEFLSDLSSMPFKILSVRGENLKVNVYGDVAVLTGVQHARVELEGGRGQTSSVAFTDVFVRRGRRWLMTLAYGVELPAAPGAVTQPESKVDSPPESKVEPTPAP